jgi:hypothetical protein
MLATLVAQLRRILDHVWAYPQGRVLAPAHSSASRTVSPGGNDSFSFGGYAAAGPSLSQVEPRLSSRTAFIELTRQISILPP